jgi:hypothetical protein
MNMLTSTIEVAKLFCQGRDEFESSTTASQLLQPHGKSECGNRHHAGIDSQIELHTSTAVRDMSAKEQPSSKRRRPQADQGTRTAAAVQEFADFITL